MGEADVAAGKKNAATRGARLIFLDESGLMLAPLVRRTWSPRGQTPIFRQSGRWREKVSAIAVLALSPRRHRVRLFFDLYPGANVTGPLLVGFLEALLRELRGPITLIWDRLGVHQSAPVREFLHRHPRLRVEVLPTYAPELNPVEYVWAYSKQNPLGNVAAVSSADLATLARPKLIRIGRRPGLLRAFLDQSPLFGSK